MKYLVILISIFFINELAFCSFTGSENDEVKTNVLVINSYHKGFVWSDDIILGIEDALNGKIFQLHIEYMDTKRQYDSIYLELLANVIAYKHEKHGFEVIITSDDNAFQFAKKYRSSIFNNVPLVFCGVNYLDPIDIAGIEKITGVSEKGDIVKNIQLIKQIHTKVKNILIVTDNTTTGKRVQSEVRKIIARDSVDIPIELVYNVSVEALKTKLQQLEEGTIVLHTFFFRDKNNMFFDYDEGAKLVCNHSSVPVYSAWNFSMGYGIVGGYLTNGYDQGYLAGEKTLQFISGIPMDEIPVHEEPTTNLAFDFRVLQKYNIDFRKLPEGSEIKYQPQSFIQRNKKLIRNLSFLIAFLSISIIILIDALRRTNSIKKQLSISEKRLRTIIDTLPSMIFIKNKKGKFLSVNKTLAASLGKRVSEVEGKYQIDLHPNREEALGMLRDDKAVLETKQELKVSEQSYHDAYGKQHWLQTTKASCPADIFDEEAVIGVSLDITQLKKTRKDLQFAYDFADNLLETANVIIITMNKNWTVKTINRYGEEITGYQRSEIINTNWIDRFIPSTSRADLNNVFGDIISEKPEVQNYENTIICKDGSIRLISWNNSVLKGTDNKVNGFLSIGIDITDRRKVLKELIESENKFKSIFDFSPFGIIYYDNKGVLVDCNESFAKLVGSEREKLIGLNLTKMPDKNLCKGIQDSLIIGNGTYNDYYHSVLVDKITPMRGVFKGIEDANGKIISGIGMVEDITLQKQAEDGMMTANKELLDATVALKQANHDLQNALEEAQKSKAFEEANALLIRQKEELNNTIEKLKNAQMQLIQAEKMASVGILTSGIAHEINNPLNFIQGGKTALELYIHDYLKEKSDDFAPFIEMIETGISRAVEIIQSLSRFNRKSDTYDELCNLSDIIDNCLVMTQNQMKHRITLIKEYTPDNVMFMGNEGKIHQVILNIMTNAEQAILNEGIIKIHTYKQKNKLIAVFEDNGSGIKPENMEKISDPFFTTKDPGKGTGLGLSIAYNIMHEHKGTIEFDSVYGKGTTVTLTFPLNE